MRSLGGVEDSLKEQLLNDFLTADIADADKTMLSYVAKLTTAPATITPEDITTLHKAGFDNQGIHDMVQVCAYFNYVNRLADGLGIELETE